MTKQNQPLDWTEPEPADPVYVSHVQLLVDDKTTFGIKGWCEMPATEEKRILFRMIMSAETAQDLYIQLWKALRPKVPKRL